MNTLNDIIASGTHTVVADFPRYTFIRPTATVELTVDDTLAIEKTSRQGDLLPQNHSLFSLTTMCEREGRSATETEESIQRTQDAIDEGRASEGWCFHGIMSQGTCITATPQGHDTIVCLRVGDTFLFEGTTFEIVKTFSGFAISAIN